MASWLTEHTYQLCPTCKSVTRHDDGVCMWDPASTIAKLVARDLPDAERSRARRHDPVGQLEIGYEKGNQ